MMIGYTCNLIFRRLISFGVLGAVCLIGWLPLVTPTPDAKVMTKSDVLFRMPGEHEPHEGTWLQWPHNYGQNRWRNLVRRYDESWIRMTLALHTGERVRIITYNE